MGRRHDKPKRNPILEYRQLPIDDLQNRITGCSESGDFRAAIDIAKECHRREPTPEHRKLLAGLYVHRGHQLIDKDLHAEALMVLGNALTLGEGSVELLRLVFQCGLRSRQYASAAAALHRLRDPTERRWASCLLADEAVAGGDAIDPLCDPSVRDDVLRTRQAFAAFENGDDAGVAAALRPIGLTSPCAGWKWLLRGLTAYVAGEGDRARVSWDRAGADGRAARLAQLLRSVLVPDGRAAPEIPGPLRARVMSRFHDPVKAMLEQIRTALDTDKPYEALDLCGKVLAAVDKDKRDSFARRLGRAVCATIADEERTARRFSRLFGLLPEDPHLIRIAALSAERDDSEDAIELWSYYLGTLHEVKAIPSPLRDRARAMVWTRMGDLAERGAGHDGDLGGFPDPIRSDDHDAVRCYRNSLGHYPADLATHQKLVDVLVRRGQMRQAEEQAVEILKRWPAHVESLLFLGSLCLDRDAFQKALRYFERAKRAEPFNDKTRGKMQLCYLSSAFRRSVAGNPDLARKDYEQAEALRDPRESSARLYCAWAAMEWRAGQADRAEAILGRAMAGGDDIACVYFMLVIELEHAGAPAKVLQRFEKLLDAEWRKGPTPSATATMVSLMLELDTAKAACAGREAHRRSLIAHLSHLPPKGMFAEEPLLKICAFLESAQVWKTLEECARDGTDRFPGNYFLLMFLGRAQLRGGARSLPRATRRLLDRAGQQAMKEGNMEVAAEIAMLLAGAPRGGRRGVMGMLGALADLVRTGAIPELDGIPEFDDPRPRGRRRRGRDRNQAMLFDDLLGPEPQEV